MFEQLILPGNLHTRRADDYNISYRCVIPKHKNEIFLSADLVLIKSNVEKSKRYNKTSDVKKNIDSTIGEIFFWINF